MSYKFPIYRCTTCGAVWFDPPGLDQEAKAFPACGIAYQTGTVTIPEPGRETAIVVPRIRTCEGTRKPFAWFDSDTFICVIPGWLDA